MPNIKKFLNYIKYTIIALFFLILLAGIILFSCEDDSSKINTYIDAQEHVSFDIPYKWQNLGTDTFTPFSSDDDISKTMLQVAIKPTKLVSLSDAYKRVILQKKKDMDEIIVREETINIQGLVAWDIESESSAFWGKERRIHEIAFVYKGKFYWLSLTASPRLYRKADKKFKESLATLKLLK
ncbi:PsbP-related protein [Candidatus Margulisiibacteriota bacterium]